MSVEKYVVTKESSSFTIIPNKVLQGLSHDLELLGFWCYLLSLPPSWNFYKSELKKSCNVGVKKLETILKKLQEHNLLHIVQNRDAQGKFAHFDLVVHNGESFKINSLEESVQPCVNNRPSVNGSTVKNTYKRNIKQNKDEQKKQEQILSASTDAHDTHFDSFWSHYPVKKNKKRAQEIWKRRRYDNIVQLILEDIRQRTLNDSQWKDEKFIPHPSTYLLNERWNDEITLVKSTKKDKKENPNERAMRLCLN